ncbi:MAG: hypothetical protein M0R46_06380 [Candidatus Muirbacterium halophilum]|nr:hypothetical protein [Candidatus Muirbacterium halophilum]
MSIKKTLNKIKRDNSISKNIESSLVSHLYEKRHSPITTHFTGYGLSECDVISVSKSNYIYEYEVKISRSDFKADFKKKKHKLMLERKCTKYKMIKENNQKVKDTIYLTSNYFYFVVPEGLVDINEIPDYAGLMYITENHNFILIKKAPLLHKVKATVNFIRQLSHNLTCKLVFRKVN